MAEIKKISTELQLLDKFLDTSGDAGASGQVLSSTGTGINWVSGSAIPGVPGGSGTLNTIPLWTPDGDTLGDSHITQNTNDIFIPRYLGHTGDGNNYIGFPANDVFNITTAGIQRFRVNADGNIGIGTTSPAAKLHVDDSVGGKLRLSNISATADGEKIGGIETGVANGTFFAGVNFFRHDANDGEIRFRTKVNNTNTDVMAIVDGNVGVGTTSPSANLDILNGTTGASLKLSATATAYWQLQRNPTTGNLNISDDALGNVMSFDQSTGNVGIGTTIPGQKLDVSGNIASNSIYLYDSTSNDRLVLDLDGSDNLQISTGTSTGSRGITFFTESSEKMRILSGGNVGIGTTSPNARLDVNGGLNGAHAIFSGQDGRGLKISTENTLNNDDGVVYDAQASTGKHLFKVSGTERMRINSSGNVGIGTTNPSVNLDIEDSSNVIVDMNTTTANANTTIRLQESGTVKATIGYDGTNNGLILTTGGFTAGNGIFIDDSQNVGIGTTSPRGKLDVVGNTDNDTDFLTIQDNDPTAGSSRPSIRFRSNTAQIGQITGLSGKMRFSSGNTENSMLEILDNGNVGIGTTSPVSKLEVSSGAGANGDSILTISADTDNSTSSSSPKILMLQKGSTKTSLIEMDSSNRTHFSNVDGHYFSGGNVGIGTTSPSSSLEVLKSASSTTISEARISSLVTGGYGGQANLWLRTSVYGSAMLAFGPQVGSSTVASSASGKISYNTFTRVFTVTADSNALLTLGGSLDRVGINQTSPLYTLDVTGNGRFTSTVTATNFINSSDKRLKENIEEVCNNNVEVSWKTFNFKTEKEQKRYGVIAQELEKTNPEFVREDSQGFKSVAYIDLLIAKIAELEARIQKLEK